MPRPVKIKKKKSFMFTSKHHSFLGVLGCVGGIVSLCALIFCLYVTFKAGGKAALRTGFMGLFACLISIMGIICGALSLNERDIYRWVPYAAIIISGVVTGLWLFMCISGFTN